MKLVLVNRKVARAVSRKRTDMLARLIMSQEGIYCSENRSVYETIDSFIGISRKNRYSEME